MIPWFRKRTVGERGERLAARALQKAGYKVLERNAQLGRYEIDIIARDHEGVAFVEVKTRNADPIFQPEDNISADKQRRLISAANVYISQHSDLEQNYRFDVVSVLLPQKGRPIIQIIRDAFRPS